MNVLRDENIPSKIKMKMKMRNRYAMILLSALCMVVPRTFPAEMPTRRSATSASVK